MYVLKNDFVEAHIAEVGAELRALKINGEDVLWSGDEKYWTGIAPLCFPLCGGMKDNKIIYKGKEYTIPHHGYAKVSTFTVVKTGKDFVTFMHKSDEETLKQYPFHYELYVTFTVHGKALDVSYKVKNIGEDDMYFAIGSHEAFATPEGIEQYDIIFNEKETLDTFIVDGPMLTHNTKRVLTDSNVLPLYYSYFDIDALLFKDIKSNAVTLRNRITGRKVKLSFNDCKYFVLWTKPGAGYICIEPWHGIKGMVDDDYDITNREGMTILAKNETFSMSHTIYM